MSRSTPRTALTTLVLAIVVMLTMTTQAYAADALVYNPLQMLNSSVGTYPGHPVRFFAGWTNPFAMDLNSLGEYANAPVYLAGSGWSTAIVKTGPDAPFGWDTYRVIGGACTWVGVEHAWPVTLALPNGNQTAGFAISHLSGYSYGPGATVPQGVQIGTLSFLSSSSPVYSHPSCAEQYMTATNPHLHIESARTGTTFNNDVDPINQQWWQPYWYYQYP
jgi:hypothetical protein